MHWLEICRFANGALLLAWALLWLPFQLHAQDVIFPGPSTGGIGSARFPTPPLRSDEQHSCYPHDSCQVRGNSRDTLPMDKRSCYCDYACAEYGDCCRDSRFYSPDSSINAVKMWHCTTLRNYNGVYLKVACPLWWSDDEIRKLCETDTSDEYDPFLRLPVTSRTTQLTYKNYHCAICNKDISSPIFWIPHLECGERLKLNLTVEEFWDRLQYKEVNSSWGITTEENTFVPCSVDPEMPSNVQDMIRRCEPFVSNCSSNWTDFKSMQECASYTTYVYVKEKAYRNWECAKCNYETEYVICSKLSTRFALPTFNSNSFTVLFDVNSQNGQQVGQIKRCEDTEVYDPFSRKCRSVICGRPGQIFRQGRCISDPDISYETESFNEVVTTDLISPASIEISTFIGMDSETTLSSEVDLLEDKNTFKPYPENFTEEMEITSKEITVTSEVTENVDSNYETDNFSSKATDFEDFLIQTKENVKEELTTVLNNFKSTNAPLTTQNNENSTMTFVFPNDFLNNSIHDLNTDVLQTKLTYEPFTTEDEFDGISTQLQSNASISLNSTSAYDVVNVTASTSATATTIQPMFNQSKHLECDQFELNRSDYRLLENGSVYLHAHKRILSLTEFRFDNEQLFVCIKSLLGSEYSNYEQKFSGYLAMVALVGLTISVLCLVLHLVAFCLVSDLRNLSGNNLASLCVALAVAYTMFILAQFNTVPSTFCKVIAVIMCYTFLASFFWMNTMAFDVWRALKQATTELRISSGLQWQKFLIYSAYSWLSPLLIIITSLVVENIPNIPEDLRPSFGTKLCWFNHRRALLLFFVVPIITIIVINIILFSFSAYMIISTTRNTAKMHTSKSQRTFRLYLRLALLMGLTWIIGIVAAAADVEPLWYVFVAFNTLQGLFIFFAFTFTKKVIQSVWAKVVRQPRLLRKQSTFVDSSSDPRMTKKSGLEARDSADSQSSHSSRSSLTQTTSVRSSVDALY